MRRRKALQILISEGNAGAQMNNTGAIDSEEAKNTLCLVRFQDNGTIDSCVSLPIPVSRAYVGDMVRMFRSSMSLAEAIRKTTGFSLKDPGKPESADDYSDSPVMVNCDPKTMFIAAPVHTSPLTWVGLIGQPMVLGDANLSRRIIPCILKAAECFFIYGPSGPRSSTELWKAIGKLMVSDNLWFNRTRFSHVLDSIVKFTRASQTEPHCSAKTCEFENVGKISNLRPFADQFCNAIREEYQCTETSLCIFSPELEVGYCENLGSHQGDVFPWYYSSFLNLGRRRNVGELVESITNGTTRLWIKRDGWVLATLFTASLEKVPHPSTRVRNYAYNLIKASSGHHQT